MRNLRLIAQEVANKYNMKRSPEARLEIIDVDEKNSIVEVMIKGSFCRTCGVDDWILDYKYELKDQGVLAELESYEIDFERELAIAKFKIQKAV